MGEGDRRRVRDRCRVRRCCERRESLGRENGRGGSYTDLRDLDVPLRSRAKIVEESGWSTTTVFETVSLLSAAQSAVRRLE